MKSLSPLRYPGGKSAIAELLALIRKRNGLGARPIAEPFAGGGGASLALLYGEETPQIHLNDADPAIHDFWWSLVNEPRRFAKMIDETRASIPEWRRQRRIYKSGRRASRLKRGFATFYLNRCNRSGIIMNGGPIGGLRQTGEWKIDARFNKAELQRRCEKIAEYSNRIEVSCQDGIDLIGSLDVKKTFFFIDPPYYLKGPTLYLNLLDPGYHASLAEKLRSMETAAWVLTYDDCREIRRMYAGWAKIHPFSLQYAASQRRVGREVLIAPQWMRLPRTQSSAALQW